jgi:hypothetical protein
MEESLPYTVGDIIIQCALNSCREPAKTMLIETGGHDGARGFTFCDRHSREAFAAIGLLRVLSGNACQKKLLPSAAFCPKGWRYSHNISKIAQLIDESSQSDIHSTKMELSG